MANDTQIIIDQARELLETLEKEYNNEIEEKNDEIRDLEKKLDDRQDEINDLENTISDLQSKVDEYERETSH